MDHYSFWQDLFDTYQSFPDWMQLLWLLVPPGFLLALIGLFMHYRLAARRSGPGEKLAYTIYAGRNGRLHIYAHEGAPPLPVDQAQLKLPDKQATEFDELLDVLDPP
ncbi:MAG: hypothetical protein AAF940_15375 [Pseudomonadota bacterium]